MPRKATLSVEQIEIVAQFADYSFDYPNLGFDAVAKKMLPRGFPATAVGREFKKQAEEVFDQEREA
jgi:hypothetical protein